MLPLEGIRVIDFSRVVSGPFGTSMLGDFGADVITVERTEGDDLRRWSSGPKGLSAVSGQYMGVNRNKRSICIDLKKDAGKKIVLSLIEKSDVIVENNKPGVMARLGLSYENVAKVSPDIIYCSISGFGQDGPYRDRAAYDFVVQAMSGVANMTGDPAPSPPMRVGLGIADLFTSLYSVTAIQAALRLREKTGHGTYLDISMLDVMIHVLSYYAGRYFATGTELPRTGSLHNMVVGGAFQTKDGKFVAVQAGNNKTFVSLFEVLGRKDLSDRLLAQHLNAGVAWQIERNAIAKVLEESFKTKSMDEWIAILNSASVPCGPVYNLEDLFSDPHVLHRKMTMEVEREPFGKVKILSNPIKSSPAIWSYRNPPSLVGEHTYEILSLLLKESDESIARLKADGIIA